VARNASFAFFASDVAFCINVLCSASLHLIHLSKAHLDTSFTFGSVRVSFESLSLAFVRSHLFITFENCNLSGSHFDTNFHAFESTNFHAFESHTPAGIHAPIAVHIQTSH